MKRAVAVFAFFITIFFSCHKEGTQLSYQGQLQKDVALIDAYLSNHRINAVSDTSGLRYVITSLGTGAKPTLTENVTISLVGEFLSNAQVFALDTIPGVVPVNSLITGFQIALPLIPKGSKFTLYLPSGLAYGPYGSSDGSVPGNTNLIFYVHLLDEDAQLKQDKATIDAYLKSKNIVATKDSSGLRYVINSMGTGDNPLPSSTINVTYTGTFLSNGTQFSSGTGTYFLSNLIPGWQIGLPFIKQGGSITLYIPSGLGYGPAGTSDGVIPSNANLIYTVQLNVVD